MRSFPSTDITRRSGELLEQVDRGPVSITRYNRPRYVVMTAEYYARITGNGDPRKSAHVGDLTDTEAADLIAALQASIDDE